VKSNYSNIRVLVARSQSAVQDGQCDDVRECDTIAEAKKFARYSLTPAYQQSAGMSAPMNYARVVADEAGREYIDNDNGEVCVADYFRKGYVIPVEVAVDYDGDFIP
jgi:hypothetical protein